MRIDARIDETDLEELAELHKHVEEAVTAARSAVARSVENRDSLMRRREEKGLAGAMRVFSRPRARA